MQLIKSYFPELTVVQIEQFIKAKELYKDWNEKINVISRKDIDEIEEKHFLHSLAIKKIIDFKDGSHILDIGTGGGFPGIPLAIMFPNVHFHLVDSIGKKIKVGKAIAQDLGLKNVSFEQNRVENINKSYDFIITRAVAPASTLLDWIGSNLKQTSQHSIKNGLIALKGGDLTEELKGVKNWTLFNISDYFKEPFFETKKILHVPLG